MFIFTAKFNKRKAVLAVLLLAAVLIAIVLIAGSISRSKSLKAKEASALSAVVKTNEQRVKYLNSLGWDVDVNPIEEQKVVIPRKFTDVYERYNEIQKAQGFDLSKFGGVEARRYTYKVLNYPDYKGNVVADIIVYRNEIIAGDVQSNAFDGFMVGLKYPKQAASPKPSATPPNALEPNAADPNATDPNAASPDLNAPNAPSENKPNAPNAANTEALTSDAVGMEENPEPVLEP